MALAKQWKTKVPTTLKCSTNLLPSTILHYSEALIALKGIKGIFFNANTLILQVKSMNAHTYVKLSVLWLYTRRIALKNFNFSNGHSVFFSGVISMFAFDHRDEKIQKYFGAAFIK